MTTTTNAISRSRTTNPVITTESPKSEVPVAQPTAETTPEQPPRESHARAPRSTVSSSRSYALANEGAARALRAELASSAEPVLRQGSRGEAVKRMQERLVAHGYLDKNDPGSVDGIFGPNTQKAVKKFQGDHGLTADGVVGPSTHAALKKQPAQPPTTTPGTTPPSTTPPADMAAKAQSIGATLQRPADLDTSAAEKIGFLKTGAPTLNPHPLTEEEGRKVFFDGMLPIASSKEAFKAASPTVAQTPDWARSAPCAYSTSWRMEEALKQAGRPDLAQKFANHDKQAVTHEVEIELRNMGFNYYAKKDCVAPQGAIGAWSRYDFHGTKQHSGHVYTILKDNGVDGRSDRIADNNGAYDHVYTPEGKCEGFWLPPGVYPQRRGGAASASPATPTQPPPPPTTSTPAQPTAPVAAPSVDPSTLPTLRRGSKGAEVVRLQQALAKAGFSPGSADGDFGPMTEAKVKEFQRSRDLDDDGVVGPMTWKALLGTAPEPEPQPGNVTTSRSALRTIGGVTAYKADGKSGVAFKSEMTIDADGSPQAYHPRNIGTDDLDNAGHPGDWWGIATDSSGKPYVQGPNDPYPGYYVSTTSLEDTRFKANDPRRYVDSEKIPFIALPGKLMNESGIKLGDFVAVRNSRNGKVAYAEVVDYGPSNHLGEGSIRLAEDLGINGNPRTGGAGSGIEYVVFPGSGNGKPRTYEEIQAEGARLFAGWGGVDQLKSTTR